MGVIETLSLALGASWASGINLYATMAILGFLNLIGVIILPDDLQVLSSPLVLGAAVMMYAIEFFADKIPGVDNVWDVIHTFIRIPAGALFAAGSFKGMELGISEDVLLVATLIGGGGVAASSHILKAGSRAVLNASPEPITNIMASLFEDALVAIGTLMAVFKPIVFLVLLGIFILFAAWLIPKIWRGIRSFLSRLRHPTGKIKPNSDGRIPLSLGGPPSSE